MKNKQTNVGSFSTAKLQVIIAIAMITVIGFSFAACDLSDLGGGTHTHSWGAWRSNATQHWKECDCGEEYGRANHTFNGNICSVCNYNKSGGTHTHSWGAWQSNATQHWKECDCGEEYGRANHTFNGDICSVCNYNKGGNNPGGTNLSLNGIWSREDGNVVSIIDGNGYFTLIDGNWKKVEGNGDIKIGSGKYRNISSTGNLTWSAQELMYNTSTYRVLPWNDCTITMASDGNTFTNYNSTSQTQYRTYTRKDNNLLNGVWDREDGNVISIIDGNGYFTVIDSDWQKVETNGDIKIGSGKYRNITSTGNLTWSAQELMYNTSTYRVLPWNDCTITMASDGNTFTNYNSTSQTQYRTYTRRR